jgi:hypothetical protein
MKEYHAPTMVQSPHLALGLLCQFIVLPLETGLCKMLTYMVKFMENNYNDTVMYTKWVVCSSVTNNSTWIRIGYRIYSPWRFTAAYNTITDC